MPKKKFKNWKTNFWHFSRPNSTIFTYGLEFGGEIRANFMIENPILTNFNHNFQG